MNPESILSVIRNTADGLSGVPTADEAKVYLDTLSHLSYLLNEATKESKAAEDGWL